MGNQIIASVRRQEAQLIKYNIDYAESAILFCYCGHSKKGGCFRIGLLNIFRVRSCGHKPFTER